MAAPKKKSSVSRQGMRSAHKKVSYDILQVCKQCGERKRMHHLCQACGFYKGRQVIVPKMKKRNDTQEAS